jgi:hypothetical protein
VTRPPPQVNKYRKWLAREGEGAPSLGSMEAAEGTGVMEEKEQGAQAEQEEQDEEGKGGRPKPQKRKSALHRLHEKVQADKQAQQVEQDQVPTRPPPSLAAHTRCPGRWREMQYCGQTGCNASMRVRRAGELLRGEDECKATRRINST